MSTRQKLVWVAALYFAEGFPFGMVMDAIPVYLRLQGVSLVDVGLLGLVGLPCTLKFLWAPAVDVWGHRRTWVWVCQALMCLPLVVLAGSHAQENIWILWSVLILFAILSATQDIAIDAYTIELLEKHEMGVANGVRVTAYRIALIAAGGLVVAAAGLAGWGMVFIGAAVLMGLLSMISSRAPLADATTSAADMAIGPMIKPFWVDRQFTPVQIGLVPGTLGVVATIGGALIGGSLTSRWGIFRALWVLGIFQAVSNLVYAAAAALPPNTALMYVASMVESFCGGLGTAPFLAFLMSICSKAHAATQYALLSALFGLTRALSGVFSGVATEGMGYAAYFTATFFLAWPAFLLLPWVKDWAGDEKGEDTK